MPLTRDEFLDACSYLTSTGALVSANAGEALFIDGDNQLVLDEGNANANITPDEPTLQQALIDLASQVSTEDEELSFVDAMKPIIRAWYKGTATTTQTLASAGAVLDNHPAHKSNMNNVVWVNVRRTVNPIADVTLGNISGNANAESAYVMALINYATQVKAWRN